MSALTGGPAIHRVQADMLGKRATQAIRMKQLDNNLRYLEVQLINDEEAFAIPEGAHVRLRGLKPDGKGVYLDAVEFSGDTVTFEINSNFLAVKGKMPCEVEVSLGEDVVKTRTFYVEVDPEALPSGAVISTDEYPALLAAADAAKLSQMAAAQSAVNAKASETNAAASEEAAKKAAREAGEAASQVINAQVEEKLTEMRQIDSSVQKNKTDAQTAADTAVAARDRAETASKTAADKADAAGIAKADAASSAAAALASEQKAAQYAEQAAGESTIHFSKDALDGGLNITIDD